MHRGSVVAALAALVLLLTAGCSGSSGDDGVQLPPDAELDTHVNDLRGDKLPFATGLVSGSGSAADTSAAVAPLKPPLVRVEFGFDTPVSQIEPYIDAYAREGSKVLLLAGFGDLPSEEQIANVGTWAKAFGPASGRSPAVTTIELGNETSYTYQYEDNPGDSSYDERAAAYAHLVVAAGNAVTAADPGVSVIAQADDGNTDSSDWVDNMFGAVPDLERYVAGWTVHPYGPKFDDRLSRTREQLAAHGATKPLWITEWGLATDGGRCLTDNYGWNKCMDFPSAASTLLQVVADLQRYDVAAFLVYQTLDQKPSDSGSSERENYFGVLTSTGGDKGAYTQAVRALWGG